MFMRTKLKKFSALIMLLCFGSMMAWAEDVVTATQNISDDGKTCTWTGITASVTKNNSCGGNGLYFYASGGNIANDNGNPNLKVGRIMYVMVPSTSATGTITIKGTQDGKEKDSEVFRSVSLNSGLKIDMKGAGDTKNFVTSDIEEVNGSYYIKLTSNSDFKFKSVSVTLTSSDSYRAGSVDQGWVANLQPTQVVPADGVLKINFKNIRPTEQTEINKNTWNNWLVALTNDQEQTNLDILRADRFGWRGSTSYTKDGGNWSYSGYDEISDEEFNTKMQGADVEIVLSRNANKLTMKAVATSADKSSTFKETFTIEDDEYASSNTIYARMTADFASLENLTYTTGSVVTTDVIGNGTAEASHNFITNSTDVTFSATPADGYLFSHWSIGGESISTENPYVVNVPGTTNYNLTANFVAPLHITYDANGATGGTAPVDNTNYKSGDVATILGQGDLTNGTKTFFGWATATDKSAGRASLLPNSSFTITADQTVYAMWENFGPITENKTWILKNTDGIGYMVIGSNSSKILDNIWFTSARNKSITNRTNDNKDRDGVYFGGGGSVTALNAHFQLGAGAYKVTVNYAGTSGQTIKLINNTTGVLGTAAGTESQLIKIFNNVADVNDLYLFSDASGFTATSIVVERLTSRTLNFRVNDGEGAVSATLDGKAINSGASVPVGSVVTLTASADEWYLTNGWYNGQDKLSQDASFDYTIPEGSEAITLDANFIRYYRVQAVSNNDSWGTAKVYSDEAHTQEITPETNVLSGNKVYVVATPASGYKLNNWSSNPGSWTINDLEGEKKVNEIADVKEIITLTATFESEQQNSDFTLKTTEKSMKVGDTWTLTKDVDYTTSSDGAVTVTVVDNSGKAVTYFANAAGAVVTATAQGTAYVKISQAATANYGAAEATITVTITRDEQTVTEMTTWDLTTSDAQTNDGEYNKLYWNAQSGTVSDNVGTNVGLKGLKLNGSQDIYFNTDGKAGTVYVTYGARKPGEYTKAMVNEVSASENVTDVATQSFAIAQGVNKVSIKRASGNEGVVTKVVWIPTGAAYEVTTNLQSIILEQSVVGDKSYFSAEIGEDPKTKTFESQSRLLYRTKTASMSVDFTVTGAKAVQIVATGAASQGGTQYTVSINGGAKQTITMSGSTDTSEPIILPEGISTITIAGTGKDVYPAKLIFYTITPSAIVVKRKNEALSISSDKLFYNEGRQTYNVTSSNTLTPITMTHTVPADVATVSFDASEGTLTITPKGGPEGNGVITFHQDGTQDGTVAEGSKALALDVIWDYYEMKYANDIMIDMNTADGPFDHDIVLKPEAYTDNGVSIPAFPTLTAMKFDKEHKSGALVTVDDAFLGALTFTTDDNTLAKNGIGEDGRGTLTVTHGRQGLVYITATFEGDAAQHISKASASYSLTVKDGIMYSVPEATPLNAQQQIKLKDGEVLKLTLTMGGYKYGKIWNGGTKPDTWSKSNEYGGGEWVNYVDGYRYQAGGPENAGCEKVQSTGSVIGVQFYEEGTAKAEGGTYGLYERVHPFSLPVRGAYLTLSPEVNGTATVYVLQNGNLNYDTSVDDQDVLKASDPLSTSPRVYYWADQDGYIIDTKTSTGVPPVAKQPLVNGNNQTRGGNGNGGYTTISADTWTSEWNNSSWATNYQKVNGVDVLAKDYITTTRTLVDGTTGVYFPDQATVNANLANKGTATDVKPQYVIPYHGGYMVMQKCYVKYVINVLAGKTYYFFSNASKLGFAGVNFKEDASVLSDGVTTVASSKVESLTLDQSNDNWLTGMDDNKGKQIKSVTLNRTFKANTWNTICLPFNVSEKQVQEIFGNVSISDGGISVSNNKATNPVDASKEAELVIYNGFTDSGFNTAHFLRHVDQNILAGQPYFIMPKRTVTNPTFKNVLVPQSVAMQTYGGNVGTIEWYKGTEDPFVFTGTLAGGNTLYQYDHYINVNDGKLYYMAEGASLSGFPAYRAYLKSNNNNVYKAKAINAVSFGNFESEDDNGYTTSIMQALIDEGVEIAPQRGVYNLKGQKVANSTKGLSKGIYIVNGHKISIK